MNQEITSIESTSTEKASLDKSNFIELFKGKFYGVLRWHHLEHIWDVVKSKKDQGWYVYEINKDIPSKLTIEDALVTEIDLIDKHLRKEHDEEYCGIVYADDLQNPEFIKVFDPKSLGTSCSIAKTPPLPKWIISKVKPEELTVKIEESNKPKHWLGNLFAKST